MMENKCEDVIDDGMDTAEFPDIYDGLYTPDSFTCSLCGYLTTNIDEYVFHMTKHEECFLVIEKSLHVDDLMLPRFRKKQKVNLEEQDKVFVEKKNLFPQDSPTITPVETDSGQRWKCGSCRITFSRQAAVLNHLKLQHPPKVEVVDMKSKAAKTASAVEITTEVEKIDSKENIGLVYDDKSFKSEVSTTACHVCGQICKTPPILNRHLAIVHSQTRPFLCSIDSCTLDFKTKGSLLRHQRRHTDSRPYKCAKCERSFRESGSLLRHQMASVSCSSKLSKRASARYGLTMPFKLCKTEEKGEWQVSLKTEDTATATTITTSTASNLTDEQADKSDHTPEESKAAVWQQIMAAKNSDAMKSSSQLSTSACLVDKKPPINLIGLKKESTATNEDQPDIEISSVQPSTSMLQEDLNKIIQKFEEPDKSDTKPPTELENDALKIIQTSHSCPVCSKSYNTEQFLIRHLKFHKGELSPSLECPSCRKCFLTLSGLCRHLVTHSNLRQFECSLCKKSFKLKAHAHVHLKSHSNEKNFTCPDCGRKFKTVSAKNAHHRAHAGVVSFECEICFRSFSTKASFQRHTRVHSGDRPFHCPYCNMAFKEHGTLNRHISHKAPCSQKHRGIVPPDNKVEIAKNIKTMKQETPKIATQENEELLSEPDSELDSYLSEFDLSSIYSDHSQMSFDPDECFLPALDI